MIYVVWMEDDDGEPSWFSVYPTKKEAMDNARSYAEGAKKVVYLKHGSEKYYFDYDAEKFVVVEQRESLHHGA